VFGDHDLTHLESDPYDEAATMLRLAIAGDADSVAAGVAGVVSRSGMRGAYWVAVCLAATLVGDGAGRTVSGAALEFPGIDRAPYDTRWVARFVSAYANADEPTGEALFVAAVADGQLPACMTTLTGSTLATLQYRAS
jgi:hypothetical protein